jgi:hypothetical protein
MSTIYCEFQESESNRQLAFYMGERIQSVPFQPVEKVPSVWPRGGVTALARVTSPPLDHLREVPPLR